MALNPVTQPALFIDSAPAISVRRDNLFDVRFEGLTLVATPKAMFALTTLSKGAFRDWNAMNNAKAAGYMVDEDAEIVPFRRRKGGRSA